MIEASAPGRVNLIGEHTDYNAGFVLPMPIPQQTRVEMRRRGDATANVWSRELNASAEYQIGMEQRRGDWLDYVMGCTDVLVRDHHIVGGFDMRIASDVPLGAGLSSSASLEVAVLRALRTAFALPIDDKQIALYGQRAENELVGAPVGAMDQLCASLGVPGAALFIDTRSLEVMPIPVSAQLDLVVIASGLRHVHATGDYKTRRAECERAAELLGVPALRDAETTAELAALPPPLDRRARHVVTENARVLAAVVALREDNFAQLGELFRCSHISMRDDFEVSVDAIDTLVEIANADPVIYGARLTGGGFGGSIVA
ncbi:MAG: galactokinase, partial [Deltaproteobacteria bacterium]|nr:galactokinase [Deltaproteobacteria bacterium]